MESDKFNVDNSSFSGNASTNSIPSDVPRDGSTTEKLVGSILSEIQELQATYEKLGHTYCALSSANPGSGERMPGVANSSTQTMLPDSGILSLIQEGQAAFQEFGQRFGAIFSPTVATGERMTHVVNSSTQTPIQESEGDLEENEDMENMSPDALLEHHKRINVGLRERAFYLSIKLHKYKSPKSTCVESKEHCSLCLDDYCEGQELAKIDCGHVYHVDCIKEWIKIKNSCPICKRDALAILT